MTDTTATSTPEHSAPTSLAQLFGQPLNGTQVSAIEIPLFQRDYAQGRLNEQAFQVRTRFIADLCAALEDGGHGLHLDFVFGDVVNGTLYPLDGQQRLTTLFLLHCYLAWQQPDLAGAEQPWHAFHYATRPGARAFCEFLTQCRPDMAAKNLPAWLCDQARYLPTWKHDPSIQGMLVVLDALHQHYQEQTAERLRAAWQRLTDPENPAIRFLLLPVAAQKLDNTLYVKMNSRGRPLTEFENFKADLEALLAKNPNIDPTALAAFSRAIDTRWADLFWRYRGDNHLIDEEFMRYVRFLLEVRAWQRGHAVQVKQGDLQAVTRLSAQLLGNATPHANEDFAWIMQALDIWLEKGADGTARPKDIEPIFAQLFTRDASNATAPLRIFNFRDFGEAPVGVNLFHACCALYGTRPWSLAHTLLFYGVLHGLVTGVEVPTLLPRLRRLRNLIEASRSEIRAEDNRNHMPALLHEVDILIAGGALTEVKTFNQVQVRNEQAKQALASQHPGLQDTIHRLEDHELLRGGLTAFDLDPEQDAATFTRRAEQFAALFAAPYHWVNAALLAKGHGGRVYRRRGGYRFTYLGTPKQRQSGQWEDHWRARFNENPHPSATALMALLDDMATGKSPQTVVEEFVNAPGTPKDWRYYLAKYEAMRGEHLGFAGNYALGPDPGYALCLPLSDSCDNRSNHHDGYLLALVHAADIPPDRIGNDGWPRCFPGYETEERHLKLRNSGLQIRCVDTGWALGHIPTPADQRSAFDQVASTHHVVDGLCAIPQTDDGVDTEDRIAIGAALLRGLVAAGL